MGIFSIFVYCGLPTIFCPYTRDGIYMCTYRLGSIVLYNQFWILPMPWSMLTSVEMKNFEIKTGIWMWKRIENYARKSLKKFKSIKWGQIWNNFQIAAMPGFRGQRNGAMTSVEIKNGIFGFVWLFWPNSLDQPQFQPPNWPLDEKTLSFCLCVNFNDHELHVSGNFFIWMDTNSKWYKSLAIS